MLSCRPGIGGISMPLLWPSRIAARYGIDVGGMPSWETSPIVIRLNQKPRSPVAGWPFCRAIRLPWCGIGGLADKRPRKNAAFIGRCSQKSIIGWRRFVHLFIAQPGSVIDTDSLAFQNILFFERTVF